jgi:peptide/nickel transport system permease protein
VKVALRNMGFSASISLFIISLMAGAALLAPIIAPYAPNDIVSDIWRAPCSRFLLGTDNVGRDVLSRLIWGARITFIVAGGATLLSFTLGVLFGFAAAMMRGWADQLLSRAVDLLMAIPTLIFALAVLSVLPANLKVLILVIALLDATRVFRVSRAIAADVVVMEFVEAAQVRGESWGWIMWREIMPNAISPLLAELGLRFVFAVIFLSTLSFLGLGIQPPTADWGGMVRDNKDGIVFGVSAALIPGGAIAALAISVNFVVDGVLQSTTSLRGRREDG